MASITIQSGAVSGDLTKNVAFDWINTGSSSCNVAPAGGTNWFTATTVPGASGGKNGTASSTPNQAGTFYWYSACCEAGGNQRVQVGS